MKVFSIYQTRLVKIDRELSVFKGEYKMNLIHWLFSYKPFLIVKPFVFSLSSF